MARFEKLHLRIGNVRLLIVVAALIGAWFSLHGDAFSAWWLLLPLLFFVAVVVFHARILRKRSCAERAVCFYERGLARIEDRWIGSGQTGDRVDIRASDIHASLYAADLDLFGNGSLFELLSLARTSMGEDTLAGWLLSPAHVSQLLQRQDAVVELRRRLDLREDLAILGDDPSPDPGKNFRKDIKASVNAEALTSWAESPNRLTPPWLRWLALVLAVAAVAAAITWAQFGTTAPFFAILIAEAAITSSLRKRTAQVLHSTGRAFEDLHLLSSLLARLEREQFESAHLQAIKTQLSSQQRTGSAAIGRLRTIVDCIQSLDNPALRLLNIPLLYAVQTAYAAEAWRAAHGASVRLWLSAIGEIEALLSLSAYSYEHPADPFPEFLDGSPCFNASALGHPLLPAATCVRNDVSVCGQTRAMLISGSNMSGKSTLMRAVGINTVLAMAGAPVRAARLQLTPFHLGASILVQDSLHEGSSRFYAEITRLRAICALAEEHPVLFLLDELLQGTNSKDRLIGAEGVVRALLATGAIGLISTHDLALTSISALAEGGLHNFHLQDEIEDGKMMFDYKLRDGIVARSNGIELMLLIGLKV